MKDTKETIHCPACGEVMEKIYIERNKHHIDVCLNGCGGILFDNKELDKYENDSDSAEEIFEAIEGKKFISVDESKQRICPICSSVMVKTMANPARNVEIDCCYTCGAKFLDNKELGKIKEYKNTQEDKNNFNQLFIDMLKEHYETKDK